MTGASTDVRTGTDEARDTAAPPHHRAGVRSPFAPTLALTVTLATGCFAIVMPLVMILHRPTPLPPPLPSLGLHTQNRAGLGLVYVLTFVVILPLMLTIVPRLVRRISLVSGGAALSTLAALLVASLSVALVVARLAGALGLGHGVRLLLVVAALWWIGAGALLARATRPGCWLALPSFARLVAPAWAVAGVLVFAAVLCVTAVQSLSAVGLALGAVAAGAVLLAAERLRLPRPPLVPGFAVDLVLLAILLLAVPDLLIFRPEAAAGNLAVTLQTGIIQFHQDFLLGPANELLHGGTMLVNTASQYGVGSLYLLAGWFQLMPIGYGTLGLLDGMLTALWFAAGYGVLRMAGVSRTLTAAALGIGVVALVFNLSYPVGSLPQDGPLRFGMPMLVVLAAVAGERYPAAARLARIAAAAVVGVSSIWSLEAFAYTVAVFAAMTCLQAWLLPGPGRLRRLARQALLAALACVGAQLIFAGLTLAASGQLPDWGQYLTYLHAFLLGELGDVTYNVPAWTPGFAVGAVYAASVVAIVELVHRRGRFAQRSGPALIALTGLTAYGIVLLSYYLDRSQSHILMHVSLPALLLGALWLSLLMRAGGSVPRVTRRAALAFGLAVSVLLVSAAWASIGARLPRSALAHVIPGAQSLPAALARLWHPPPLNTAAPAGVRLLARYMPRERRSLVVVSPDLGTEILMRSHRVDRLFLGDPIEASFVAKERLPDLRRAVSTLRPGDRMLMDANAEKVLRILSTHPSVDPLSELRPVQGSLLPRDLAPLQQWALARINQRFALSPIQRDAQGFVVVQLEPRPGAASASLP